MESTKVRVTTAQIEEVRELLGVPEDEFEGYCKWAWGQVRWSLLQEEDEQDEEDASVSEEDLPQEPPAQQVSGPQNQSVFGSANINAVTAADVSAAVQEVAVPELQIPPLRWGIDSESIKLLGPQIQRQIEEQGRGKLCIKTRRNGDAPWFLLVVLINACRRRYNYSPRITAPPLVKDQTATVMWNLMRIASRETAASKTSKTVVSPETAAPKTSVSPKTAVKNAAKAVYRHYGHGDFQNVNALEDKHAMVGMLKRTVNYPLDLDDQFYVWILFYTANLERKAISKAQAEEDQEAEEDLDKR
ncbi:Protein of unknown function [Pyronema omphalodes CBS 100304]|uniref:Uncharacterized protein n=1 Tax=Pyronema omphalodes (strain CBS 100304) TaxID=1076935 RepID=U4LAA5_PYROM|nr:Protein of unknown function [Pyronema omphalodes CBS 100304]